MKDEERMAKKAEEGCSETVQERLLGYLQAEGVDIERFRKLGSDERQKLINEIHTKYQKKVEIIKEISCFFD